MGEVHPNPRPDLKAVLFLVITLGLAALELWGLIRLFYHLSAPGSSVSAPALALTEPR